MVQQPQQGQCTQCSANRVNSADELPEAEKAAQPCGDSQQKDKAEAAVRHGGKANHAVMAESNGAGKRGTEHGTEQQHPIEVVPAPAQRTGSGQHGQRRLYHGGKRLHGEEYAQRDGNENNAAKQYSPPNCAAGAQLFPDGGQNTDGGKKIITDKRAGGNSPVGKQWADGWDCSNGKLPAAAAQGKRADQHRADNQQRHHGGKDIYHAGGAGKGKQRNQKAERRTAPKGGGTQYLREKRPHPGRHDDQYPEEEK